MDVLVIVDLETDGLTLAHLLDEHGIGCDVQLSHTLQPSTARTVVVDLFTQPDGGSYLLRDLIAAGRRVLAVVDDADAWNATRSHDLGAEIVLRAELDELPQRLEKAPTLDLVDRPMAASATVAASTGGADLRIA